MLGRLWPETLLLAAVNGTAWHGWPLMGIPIPLALSRLGCLCRPIWPACGPLHTACGIAKVLVSKVCWRQCERQQARAVSTAFHGSNQLVGDRTCGMWRAKAEGTALGCAADHVPAAPE
jgi:hypothetical protein